MRDDLNKLLCERERSGSGKSFGYYRHKKGFVPNADGDNVAMRESISRRNRRWGGDCKAFGEFLSPLKGQVRKYCGKRYDAFYSDLCRNFDMSRPINAHLKQHLDQYLIPMKDLSVGGDGKVWVRLAYAEDYRLNERPRWGHGPEFYVDPRDGIIKRVKNRKAQPKAEPVQFVEIDKDNVLRLIDGTWFHFVMKDCAQITITYEKPDGVELFKSGWNANRMVAWDRLRDFEKRQLGVVRYSAQRPIDLFTGKFVEKGRYHTEKRTACKKMLRDAGLK